MLGGLEAVELSLSEVENGNRIDAELYNKELVIAEKKIKNQLYTTLSKEAGIIKKGIFDIKADCYTTAGIPFVRISNLKSMLIDDDEIVYIPIEEHLKNEKTGLVYGDIILSKTATAAASFVNLKECNTSQDTVALKLKTSSQLLSEYVVVFLNSTIGLKAMQRWFTGNIQMHLNLDDAKEKLLIPVFSGTFQKAIKNLFHRSIEATHQSKSIYSEAENSLLKELGLTNWEPTIKNSNIKTLKGSFLHSGRIDAEYYQPKFDEIETILLKKKHCRIKEIRTFNSRGLQPLYNAEGMLDVINSKHILENTLDYENFEKTNSENWELQEKARVYKNDILTYTTGANIGRTQTYLIEKPAIASNHVNILRVKEINAVYVGFVINSLIGRLQTEKYSAGSAQSELYPKDLDEFLIPIINERLQIEISQKTQQSLGLQAQSKQLLNIAKKSVEIAIEQNEKAALNYMNKSIL